MSAEQLTFWEAPHNENVAVWEELTTLKMKQNNLRRGMFQRYDDILDEIACLKAEIAQLKEHKLKTNLIYSESDVCLGLG